MDPQPTLQPSPTRESVQLGLDALPDAILIADGSGVVTHANSKAREQLGAAVGQQLATAMRLQDQEGRDWYDVNQPYVGINIRRGIPEQSWVLTDGSEVLVATGIHRSGTTGEIDRVAVSIRSGRGRARLDRERSDLVATVAHELRSPLTGVRGFVQVLLNKWDKLNDEQKKLMLTTVSADSERLSRLIAELLDVARIDTGRLSMYPRPSDSVILVGRVVDLVAAGTSRPIELDAEPDLPQVHVDPDKFTQVITNLVENGVRHGEGTVRITMCALDDDAAFPGVRMTVDDQGTGIPPEMRRRVLTKFWTHGERGGSGLGMYLVNGLVRAHGGALRITDAPGGGARITIDWPSEDLRHA
ncbi:MAG TPA: ATP-binding protein [Nocardioides sp.]